jgi:hypothetical protein
MRHDEYPDAFRDDAIDLAAWGRHADAANGFGQAPADDPDPATPRSHAMQPVTMPHVDSTRYAKTIEVSKRVRWEIDRDVIRGRDFDFGRTFLPRSLSLVDRLPFLSADEQRLYSQVQGRTYTNMFALVERFIGAKALEVTHDHQLGDQVAFEALVRLTDEELKHQALFRRLEAMIAKDMPAGYTFLPQPNEVATAVLSKSTWAVLALITNIELFSQAHYHSSIEPDDTLSPLFKDVLLFHWKEESQHAILDELEWQREDAKITGAERDAAVDDLIALVGDVDGICQAQSAADAKYFVSIAGRAFTTAEVAAIGETMLAAYRWQYIASGAKGERFNKLLGSMITPAQGERIGTALAPLVN